MEQVCSLETHIGSSCKLDASAELVEAGDTPADGDKDAASKRHDDNGPKGLTSCAICLDATNGRPHRCGQCAPGAWACCEGCELSLLDRLCPVCRGDYARAPREWSKLAALQAATGESVTSLALVSVPSQLGLIELAHAFPRLEHLSIIIPRVAGGSDRIGDPARAAATGDTALLSENARNVGETGEEIADPIDGNNDNVGESIDDDTEGSTSFAVGQPLDFAAAGVVFPRLTSLELDGLPRLERLVFTPSNSPRLARLAVRRCGRKCSQLLLTLPRLTELELVDLSWDPAAANAMLGGALNGCPRLLSCSLTRVHGLGGDHFLGLPRLTKFIASHCDGLEQLDLVDCPQLAEVVFNGSKQLKRVRLHDVGIRTAKYSPFHLASAPTSAAAVVVEYTAPPLGSVSSEGTGASIQRGAAAEESIPDEDALDARGSTSGRPLSLWNVEDSIGFGVEDAGALAVALDEVRASVEDCVRDEELLWARGTRGAAEARSLGWLRNDTHSDGDGMEGSEVVFELFTTHARHLDDHLAALFECTYNQARKHVVQRAMELARERANAAAQQHVHASIVAARAVALAAREFVESSSDGSKEGLPQLTRSNSPNSDSGSPRGQSNSHTNDSTHSTSRFSSRSNAIGSSGGGSGNLTRSVSVSISSSGTRPKPTTNEAYSESSLPGVEAVVVEQLELPPLKLLDLRGCGSLSNSTLAHLTGHPRISRANILPAAITATCSAPAESARSAAAAAAVEHRNMNSEEMNDVKLASLLDCAAEAVANTTDPVVAADAAVVFNQNATTTFKVTDKVLLLPPWLQNESSNLARLMRGQGLEANGSFMSEATRRSNQTNNSISAGAAPPSPPVDLVAVRLAYAAAVFLALSGVCCGVTLPGSDSANPGFNQVSIDSTNFHLTLSPWASWLLRVASAFLSMAGVGLSMHARSRLTGSYRVPEEEEGSTRSSAANGESNSGHLSPELRSGPLGWLAWILVGAFAGAALAPRAQEMLSSSAAAAAAAQASTCASSSATNIAADCIATTTPLLMHGTADWFAGLQEALTLLLAVGWLPLRWCGHALASKRMAEALKSAAAACALLLGMAVGAIVAACYAAKAVQRAHAVDDGSNSSSGSHASHSRSSGSISSSSNSNNVNENSDNSNSSSLATTGSVPSAPDVVRASDHVALGALRPLALIISHALKPWTVPYVPGTSRGLSPSVCFDLGVGLVLGAGAVNGYSLFRLGLMPAPVPHVNLTTIWLLRSSMVVAGTVGAILAAAGMCRLYVGTRRLFESDPSGYVIVAGVACASVGLFGALFGAAAGFFLSRVPAE